MGKFREVYLPIIKMKYGGFPVEIQPYFKQQESEDDILIEQVRFNLRVQLSKHRDFCCYNMKIIIEDKELMGEFRKVYTIDKLLKDKKYNEYNDIFKANALKKLCNTSTIEMINNSHFHLFKKGVFKNGRI